MLADPEAGLKALTSNFTMTVSPKPDQGNGHEPDDTPIVAFSPCRAVFAGVEWAWRLVHRAS